MIIWLNFAGELEPGELERFRQVIWGACDHRVIPDPASVKIQVRDIPFEWDDGEPFPMQVAGLIAACELDTMQWQSYAIATRVPVEPAHAVKLLIKKIDILRGYTGYVRRIKK